MVFVAGLMFSLERCVLVITFKAKVYIHEWEFTEIYGIMLLLLLLLLWLLLLLLVLLLLFLLLCEEERKREYLH